MNSTSPTNLFSPNLTCFLFLLFVLGPVYSGSLSHSRLEISSEAGYPFYTQKNEIPLEKVYIQLDRNSYYLGDEIWFKSYLVDGKNNRPLTQSKVVYVELISADQKIIARRTIVTKNGGGEGSFTLMGNLVPGDFMIRAYTNYMRNFDPENFYRKMVPVLSASEILTTENKQNNSSDQKDTTEPIVNLMPDIQFFPEGGYLVSGLSSKIGFKALNSFGKSVSINGRIVDQNDTHIVSFSTLKLGTGSFRFTPDADSQYKAVIDHGDEEVYIELPKQLKQGVVLQLVDRGDIYQINLQSSLKNGLKGLVLEGYQGGEVAIKAEIQGDQKNGLIKIPKKSFRTGIVKFTLFTEKRKPLCERLVFYESNESGPGLKLVSDKKNYNNRELVQVEVTLEDASQSKANLSMTVVDYEVDQEDCGLNIKSYLLLSSELKGNIENPCLYFDPEEPDRKKMLDLLMITQGWRKYLWNEIEETLIESFQYPFESGIDFKGTIRSLYNHDITVNADVTLTYKNRLVFGHDEGRTFGEGKFLFPGYIFKDTTSIIIQARKKKKDKRGKVLKDELNRDFYIRLDSVKIPEIDSSNWDEKSSPEEAYNKWQDPDYLAAFFADQPSFVGLDEVEINVKGKKKLQEDKYFRKTMRYAEPRFRVDYEKDNVVAFGNDLFWNLKNRVPGLRYANGEYYYRGSKVVFFLDGVRFEDARSINTLINANDVSFIDVLSGPQASSYLAQAAVVVYLKKPGSSVGSSGSNSSKGVLSFIYPGTYKAKSFYKPKYEVDSSGSKETDYRITLHWEPSILLDSKGRAIISFYTADPSSQYKIYVEGITENGIPLKGEAFFEVEDR